MQTDLTNMLEKQEALRVQFEDWFSGRISVLESTLPSKDKLFLAWLDGNSRGFREGLDSGQEIWRDTLNNPPPRGFKSMATETGLPS